MAGYVIYSLDWPKFRDLVEQPTPQQLSLLAKALAEELENLDGEFEEGDPILKWPTGAKALAPIVAERLALEDWYGDLSAAGQELWEMTIFGACQNSKKLGLDFRADNDGVYWDVVEAAWKHLGVAPNTITDLAFSTFGTRPFRCHRHPTTAQTHDDLKRADAEKRASLGALSAMLSQFTAGAKQGKKNPANLLEEIQSLPGASAKHKNLFKNLLSDEDSDDDADDDDGDARQWSPMHSMHTPDEIERMCAELKSIEPAMQAAKKKSVREQYQHDLLPALERIFGDGRMLFVQVDT